VDFKIVYNEELSQNPEDEFQKIFLFLGLKYSHGVKDYITHSTSSGSDEKSKVGIVSPVNTVRDSLKYSRNSILNIDDKMKAGISRLFENIDVIDELLRYREGE